MPGQFELPDRQTRRPLGPVGMRRHDPQRIVEVPDDTVEADPSQPVAAFAFESRLDDEDDVGVGGEPRVESSARGVIRPDGTVQVHQLHASHAEIGDVG